MIELLYGIKRINLGRSAWFLAIVQLMAVVSLSAPALSQEFCNLDGGWIAHVPNKNFTHDGYKIAQDGNKLSFNAYDGNKSSGYFQIVATDWGDVKAVLKDKGNKIEWDNGSYWVRESPASGRCNLSGSWIAHVPSKNFTHDGYKIAQDVNKLTFIAYDGNKSSGYFNVIASEWDSVKGGIKNNGNRIDWDNGSYWVRE
jgi:hypothetical protein